MILYGHGTHYVSTCYEIIVMRVHFMTVHITVQHVIIYGQRKVKCKASATIIVRSLCLFTFLAQASSPSLAACIPLMSAQTGSLNGMPHFPIPPNQGGKSLPGGEKFLCMAVLL